jgi:hypothetical protein
VEVTDIKKKLLFSFVILLQPIEVWAQRRGWHGIEEQQRKKKK